MGGYSSDSDSDRSSRHRRKHRRRSRSSSSSSSSSHRKRSSNKYSKSRHSRYRSRSRSRGRDKGSKSHRYHSNSRDRDSRRRYHSQRSRSHSSERSRRRGRSISREKSMSSRSRSSSQQSIRIAKPFSTVSDKFSTITIKDDFRIEPRFQEGVLDEINAEGFTPKQFSSSHKENKLKNIVIDITGDTIQVPAINNVSSNNSDSVFHSSIMLDQDARFDKWVKKLYTLRQKAISDLTQNTI